MQQSLRFLVELGTPAEFRAAASAGRKLAARPKVNSHIHLPPNFSAFTRVEQAIRLSREQGVRVLGSSNYYDYSVYDDMARLCGESGIFPLFGIETICLIDKLVSGGVKINDPGNPGKMYLCGKGITRFGEMTAEGWRLLEQIRTNDSQRMALMVSRMEEVFAANGAATKLSVQRIVDRIVERHGCSRESVFLQERHVAQAFQEAFFEQVEEKDRLAALTRVFGTAPKSGAADAAKLQNELRSQLMKTGKPAFVEETFLNYEESYQLLLALGGIPCYPVLVDGANPVCTFEDSPQKLIDQLSERKVYAAEFIPARNKVEVLAEYVYAMRKAGFVITAGTEHNTPDLIPMEPSCIGGTPIPSELRDLFWEGACVVAAHQFLAAHGEVGYVDGSGALNSAYSGTENRISELRALGEAIFAKYLEQ